MKPYKVSFFGQNPESVAQVGQVPAAEKLTSRKAGQLAVQNVVSEMKTLPRCCKVIDPETVQYVELDYSVHPVFNRSVELKTYRVRLQQLGVQEKLQEIAMRFIEQALEKDADLHLSDLSVSSDGKVVAQAPIVDLYNFALHIGEDSCRVHALSFASGNNRLDFLFRFGANTRMSYIEASVKAAVLLRQFRANVYDQ